MSEPSFGSSGNFENGDKIHKEWAGLQPTWQTQGKGSQGALIRSIRSSVSKSSFLSVKQIFTVDVC